MRRFATTASTLIATAVTFLIAGTPAFAMPIAPTGDDASSRAIGHSTGLVLWQTSLIVVAIVVAVGAVAMFLVRASRHASLRHATH